MKQGGKCSVCLVYYYSAFPLGIIPYLQVKLIGDPNLPVGMSECASECACVSLSLFASRQLG